MTKEGMIQFAEKRVRLLRKQRDKYFADRDRSVEDFQKYHAAKGAYDEAARTYRGISA
jgi:hypothetical protein